MFDFQSRNPLFDHDFHSVKSSSPVMFRLFRRGGEEGSTISSRGIRIAGGVGPSSPDTKPFARYSRDRESCYEEHAYRGLCRIEASRGSHAFRDLALQLLINALFLVLPVLRSFDFAGFCQISGRGEGATCLCLLLVPCLLHPLGSSSSLPLSLSLCSSLCKMVSAEHDTSIAEQMNLDLFD